MCFLQVPPSYRVKGRFILSPASVLLKWFTVVLWSIRVSIKTYRQQALSLHYVVQCFLCFLLLTLSVLHQTLSLFFKQQIAFISFVGWKKKTLFMWPILYFLILFISYCCVQYYSSSIYRYILVKRNTVSIIGANFT